MKAMLIGLAVVLTSFESFAAIASEEEAEYYNYIQCQELITKYSSNLEFVNEPDRSEQQMDILHTKFKMTDEVAAAVIYRMSGELAGEVRGYLAFASEIYGSTKVSEIKFELYEKYQCQRFHKPVTP